MTRRITDDQIKRMKNICDDVEGLIECNCGDPCEGTCTYSMAVAMIEELKTLPTIQSLFTSILEEIDQEPQPRNCEMCGAIEGRKHHDEDYRLLVVDLKDHNGRLHCQPCLEGRLEAENPAEYLLAKAAKQQTDFWNTLSELEAEIGCEVESTTDLEGATVEDLKAGEDA